MRLKTLFVAAAALSLTMSGPAAAAGSARALSLANGPAARAGASIDDANDLGRRGGVGVIIGIVLLLGALVYVVTNATKDNNLPGSP